MWDRRKISKFLRDLDFTWIKEQREKVLSKKRGTEKNSLINNDWKYSKCDEKQWFINSRISTKLN